MRLQELTANPVIPRYRTLAPALLALGLGCLSVTLLFVDNSYLYGLVAVLFVLCFGPMWFAWRRGTLDFFEPIQVIGVIYFAYFGMGAMWAAADPRAVYDLYLVPYVPTATLYCVLGYAATLLGYYAPWSPRARPRPFEDVPQGVRFLALAAAMGTIGYLAASASRTAQTLGEALPPVLLSVGQLAPLFLFAWALAWMLFFSGQATHGQKLLLFCAMVPAAGLIGRSLVGGKAQAVTLMGLPLVSYWYARRRLPWKGLLVVVGIWVFVVFPVYNTYRQFDVRIEQSLRLSMTAQEIGTWDSASYIDASVGAFKRRLALINSVAVVVRDVGRWVPYARGETIVMPFLLVSVPRFIWPDKPVLRLGHGFGDTFRVLNVNDTTTEIAPTLPGELYWNFALPGMLIGMFLWGAAMRFLYRRLAESPHLDPLRRALYIIVLVSLVHFESSLAPTVVGVARMILVVGSLAWVLRKFGLLRRVVSGHSESKTNLAGFSGAASRAWP